MADSVLTLAESLLASRIQFDAEVLHLVKDVLGRDIEPYEQGKSPRDGSDWVIRADEVLEGSGFTVRLADEWDLNVLYGLRRVLPPTYWAFLTEDFSYRPGVTVLKTTDPYDILRVYQTHGWDYDDRYYASEDLIQLLLVWQQECRLDMVGAGIKNIKLILETLPADLVAFAEKVNHLCWELDQINHFGHYGEDTAENRVIAEKLAMSLRETRRLYLWWD